MDKAMSFTASQEFMDILSEARWHLKKTKAELIRDSVMEYIERHLPKEVKENLLKKGGK